MKKIVVYSSTELHRTISYRLQQRFPDDLVTPENQLTRAFSLQKKPVLAKRWLYNFISEDTAMTPQDEGLFFLLVWEDEQWPGFLEIINQVYADDTHWRYFMIVADGNPIKTIAGVLNYDLGLPVNKNVLKAENYEYIP